MAVRPVHRVKPTTAEAEEAGLLRKMVGLGDVIIETIHDVERGRATEAVFQVDVAEVEAFVDQCEICLIERIEKFRTPDPRRAGRGLGWLHHSAVPPLKREAFLLMALPLARSDGGGRLHG